MSIAVGIAATLKIAPFILSQEIIGLHQLNQSSLRLGRDIVSGLMLQTIGLAHSQCQ